MINNPSSINFADKKINIIRKKISQVLFIKNIPWKSNKYWYVSFIYNICILLITTLGLIPIILHIADPHFEENNPEGLGIYYAFALVGACIYLIDYGLRLFTLPIYYETTSYKKALKKQLLSFHSNYQCLSALCIIILTAIFCDHKASYLTFNNRIFSNNVAMVIFSFLFLMNILSIFSRIIICRINVENFKTAKRIIFSKRKTILIVFLIMMGMWLLFSYVIFMFEKNAQDSSITTIGQAMYFTFTTMTTLGLGDFKPVTNGGRVVTVIDSIFGVCFYAYVGSIFVNIYIEYINKKKQIRYEVINQKTKENENKKLLCDINELILKNLFLSGVITEEKYKELLAQSYLEEKQKIIYTIEDFEMNEKDKEIYLIRNELEDKKIPLGKKVFDNSRSREALEHYWLISKHKPHPQAISSVLYCLPHHFIDKMKEPHHMPIIFSSNFIDENVEKIIAFRKKTLKSAILEINLYATIAFEKENAWRLFGHYTNMSKSKFDMIFRKKDKINVLFVKEYVVYNHYKPLESFGINTNAKIEDIYYLK